eukprot:scaffold63303_cov33-Prasinocladus_malaysianus.AAC.1
MRRQPPRMVCPNLPVAGSRDHARLEVLDEPALPAGAVGRLPPFQGFEAVLCRGDAAAFRGPLHHVLLDLQVDLAVVHNEDPQARGVAVEGRAGVGHRQVVEGAAGHGFFEDLCQGGRHDGKLQDHPVGLGVQWVALVAGFSVLRAVGHQDALAVGDGLLPLGPAGAPGGVVQNIRTQEGHRAGHVLRQNRVGAVAAVDCSDPGVTKQALHAALEDDVVGHHDGVQVAQEGFVSLGGLSAFLERSAVDGYVCLKDGASPQDVIVVDKHFAIEVLHHPVADREAHADARVLVGVVAFGDADELVEDGRLGVLGYAYACVDHVDDQHEVGLGAAVVQAAPAVGLDPAVADGALPASGKNEEVAVGDDGLGEGRSQLDQRDDLAHVVPGDKQAGEVHDLLHHVGHCDWLPVERLVVLGDKGEYQDLVDDVQQARSPIVSILQQAPLLLGGRPLLKHLQAALDSVDWGSNLVGDR